jgi:hypothetical protein
VCLGLISVGTGVFSKVRLSRCNVRPFQEVGSGESPQEAQICGGIDSRVDSTRPFHVVLSTKYRSSGGHELTASFRLDRHCTFACWLQ